MLEGRREVKLSLFNWYDSVCLFERQVDSIVYIYKEIKVVDTHVGKFKKMYTLLRQHVITSIKCFFGVLSWRKAWAIEFSILLLV